MQSPFIFTHTQPSIMEVGKKYPAIFLMHGMGSNEHDLPPLVTSFKEQCHIFSLQGPIKQSPGYAFFTIQEEGKPDRAIFDKIIVHLQQFILEAIAHYELDMDNIFLLGFSQGAVLVQTLSVTMGLTIKGIVALSGYLPDFVQLEYAKRSVDHLKVFISHGEYDYVIPSQWGAASRDYFTEIGADVTFFAHQDGHGVTPENHQALTQFLALHLQTTVQ